MPKYRRTGTLLYVENNHSAYMIVNTFSKKFNQLADDSKNESTNSITLNKYQNILLKNVKRTHKDVFMRIFVQEQYFHI